MTILGTYDFSMAGLDPEKLSWNCDAILFADGRISRDPSHTVIIDTAPKLTVLAIRVEPKDGTILWSEVAVGYAGASALVALSVLTFAGHVLKNLRGEAVPSVDQVAVFIGEAFKASLHEYSQNKLDSANMAVVVCMPSISDGIAERREVRIVWGRDGYEVSVTTPTHNLSLVSGPNRELLDKQIRIAIDETYARRFPGQIDAEHLLVHRIEEFARAHSDGLPFGGQLQICRIGSFGIKLAATQFWDFSYRGPDLPQDWNHGDYRTLILGYDVFDLRVGQCDFVKEDMYSLPDTNETRWAKRTMKTEERSGDDGDLFSRPRRGFVDIHK